MVDVRAGHTPLLDAIHQRIHVWVRKRKMTKAGAYVIAVHAIVVGELQGKVGLLWPSSQEGIGVLLLHQLLTRNALAKGVEEDRNAAATD